MRRREFITLLGGAAAAWPLAARGQQGERMRRIGALLPFNAEDAEGKTIVAALRQGLEKLEWVEGRNIRIDFRFGGGDVMRTQIYARELVDLSPEAIYAHLNGQLAPLSRATRTNSSRLRRHFGPRRGRLCRKFCAPRPKHYWVYPF